MIVAVISMRYFLKLRPASGIETRAIEFTGFEPFCEFVDIVSADTQEYIFDGSTSFGW